MAKVKREEIKKLASSREEKINKLYGEYFISQDEISLLNCNIDKKHRLLTKNNFFSVINKHIDDWRNLPFICPMCNHLTTLVDTGITVDAKVVHKDGKKEPFTICKKCSSTEWREALRKRAKSFDEMSEKKTKRGKGNDN